MIVDTLNPKELHLSLSILLFLFIVYVSSLFLTVLLFAKMKTSWNVSQTFAVAVVIVQGFFFVFRISWKFLTLFSFSLFFLIVIIFHERRIKDIYANFLEIYYSKSTYLLINLITNITNFSSEHIIPVYSFTRLILTHSNSSNPCHHSILGNTNNKKKSQQYNFNERLNRLLNWKIKEKKEGNIITQLQ